MQPENLSYIGPKIPRRSFIASLAAALANPVFVTSPLKALNISGVATKLDFFTLLDISPSDLSGLLSFSCSKRDSADGVVRSRLLTLQDNYVDDSFPFNQVIIAAAKPAFSRDMLELATEIARNKFALKDISSFNRLLRLISSEEGAKEIKDKTGLDLNANSSELVASIISNATFRESFSKLFGIDQSKGSHAFSGLTRILLDREASRPDNLDLIPDVAKLLGCYPKSLGSKLLKSLITGDLEALINHPMVKAFQRLQDLNGKPHLSNTERNEYQEIREQLSQQEVDSIEKFDKPNLALSTFVSPSATLELYAKNGALTVKLEQDGQELKSVIETQDEVFPLESLRNHLLWPHLNQAKIKEQCLLVITKGTKEREISQKMFYAIASIISISKDSFQSSS